MCNVLVSQHKDWDPVDAIQSHLGPVSHGASLETNGPTRSKKPIESQGRKKKDINPGDYILLKDCNREKLGLRWKGPYQVFLTTEAAVKMLSTKRVKAQGRYLPHHRPIHVDGVLLAGYRRCVDGSCGTY
ncbi:hypothetical protein chiPu_0009865 [Chiloscyllium punctatum]|uniref:Uncharacterized protein n=1 Tax=Chiloscyllium punctatum TaxID=137246 RepID=A0A401SLY0_CHIPU|nr:hypothetical protein [Chiloscyllium punctatum]